MKKVTMMIALLKNNIKCALRYSQPTEESEKGSSVLNEDTGFRLYIPVTAKIRTNRRVSPEHRTVTKVGSRAYRETHSKHHKRPKKKQHKPILARNQYE